MHNDTKVRKSIYLKRITTLLMAVTMATEYGFVAMASTNKMAGVVDITPTIPNETTAVSSSINLLQSISQGDPFHNIIDYIGFKNMTEKDIDAFKWSFVLSQMAEPLEEGLENVLRHDVVLQMKEMDLSISTAPSISDKDYTYNQIDTDFKIDKYKFGTVYDTISKNIRYNKLWDKYGNQFTVRSFFDSNTRKENIGYISDYVYKNKGTTKYQTFPEIIKNYDYLCSADTMTNASNLVDYWREPEKLIKDDGSNSLEGQRRLVPVFVGSNITDMYLQIAMMCYCKRNSASGMTFEKFIGLYGACEMWVDSFGNIVFYDQATSKYKMVLPNACNPVFTTNDSARDKESLLSEDFLARVRPNRSYSNVEVEGLETEQVPFNDRANFNFTGMNGYSDNKGDGAGSQGIEYNSQFVGEANGNPTFSGWSEKTFIYNKWIGSVYSIKRRSSEQEYDDSKYYDIESSDTIGSAYYPSYLGPLVDSRIDYRSSLVFAKGVESHLPFVLNNYYNKTEEIIGVDGFKKIGEWLKKFLTGTQNIITIPYPETGQPMTVYSVNDSNTILDNKYFPINQVLFNSLLLEGNKKYNKEDGRRSKEAVYTMFEMAQKCTAVMTQASKDSVLPSSAQMDLIPNNIGGGISQYVYDKSLVDVSDAGLLGDEGGFLRRVNLFYKADLDKYKTIQMINGKPIDVNKFKLTDYDDYSAEFWTKRDNRISNRWNNYPSDDVAVLSYTWLNDYLDETIISSYFKDGKGSSAVKGFLDGESKVTEDYKNEYVMLPFNVENNGGSSYELTACTIPYEPNDQAGLLYKSLDNPEAEFKIPDGQGNELAFNPEDTCTNSAVINTYSLIMGLYKNTDTQYNYNQNVEVIDVDTEVDIASLAHKIEYSMTNPITALANLVSGVAQYLHNIFGVGAKTSFTLGIDENVTKELLKNYAMIMTVFIIVAMCISMVISMAHKGQAVRAMSLALALGLLLSSVPVTYRTLQGVNKKIVSGMMEKTVDRTTLISVQQSISGLINTDAKAEKNWKAYREQFSGISDVFEEGIIYIPMSIDLDGVKYEACSIDKLVTDIKYTGASSNQMTDDYKWYELPIAEDSYPLYSRYFKDVTKYFYDNLMGSYMTYYEGRYDCDQGTVINQYTGLSENSSERTSTTDRLDKILHQLKGGFNPMIYDKAFRNTRDVFGIARFFSIDVINPYAPEDLENKDTNIMTFAPVLERGMRSNSKLKPYINREGDGIIPYTTNGLKYESKGERESFLWDYSNMEDYTVEPTYFEDLIQKVYSKADSRIRSLCKYRTGEFSDTALMYTSSIILVDEMAKQMAKMVYGPPDVTDMDKVMRVIYCRDINDIYNSEELMYVIMDGIIGGGFLSILVLLIEISILIVNLIYLLDCLMAVTIMPFCIVTYFDGSNKIFRSQLFGMFTQLLIGVLSLVAIQLPLSIGVTMANSKPTNLMLWAYTIIYIICCYFIVKMSLRFLKVMLKDYVTMGGESMLKTLGGLTATAGVASLIAGESMSEIQDSSISLDNGSVEMSNSNVKEEIDGDSSQVAGISLQEIDAKYDDYKRRTEQVSETDDTDDSKQQKNEVKEQKASEHEEQEEHKPQKTQASDSDRLKALLDSNKH